MLITTLGMPRGTARSLGRRPARSGDPADAARAAGIDAERDGFLALLGRREAARLQWGEFFETWDVIVCPTTLDSAFPHTTGKFEERTLQIDGATVRYSNLSCTRCGRSSPASRPPPSRVGSTRAVCRWDCKRSVRTWKTAPRCASPSSSNEEWQTFQPPPAYA